MLKKLLTLLLLVCQGASAGQFDELGQVPSAYKGRFRPLDATANLWLEELHNDKSMSGLSATDLLLKMHFFGHKPWDSQPLFYIKEKKIQEILNGKYASYNDLNKAFFEDPDVNLKLMKILLSYQFLESYSNPSNRGKGQKQELSQLSPGLWLMFKDNDIVIAEVPDGPLWQFLKKGTIVLENGKSQSKDFLKKNKKNAEEILRLISKFQEYKSFEHIASTYNGYIDLLNDLQKRDLSNKEIVNELETRFPVAQRLKEGNSSLKLLPSRYEPGEWLPINALGIKTFNPNTSTLEPVPNFTAYTDDAFNSIRNTYLQLQESVLRDDQTQINIHSKNFSSALNEGYSSIAKTTYKIASNKKLDYPSEWQLSSEWTYVHFPLTLVAIVLYGAALALFYFYANNPSSIIPKACLATAFIYHTFLLALRCYILGRPPVSNMFETVLYVPWVTMLLGYILYFAFKKPLSLIAGGFSAFILLGILEITHLNSSFENVQAVLDSQYWLIIHVLLVVGSYGAFALSGILGHVYLYLATFKKKNQTDPSMVLIAKIILQSMYAGLAMLIPGTILGGVWAAESWGRFWDWDPKESWAFISICTYLIWVHCFRFGKIHHFGLAMGSAIGLLVISFTWYGVNYILGTGLHSYGFGSGGDIYYFAFLFLDLCFLVSTILIRKKTSLTFNHKS